MIGRYALEIYVLQGLVFILLRNNIWEVSNNYLFILLTIPFLFIFSYLFHPLFVKVMNINK